MSFFPNLDITRQAWVDYKEGEGEGGGDKKSEARGMSDQCKSVKL